MKVRLSLSVLAVSVGLISGCAQSTELKVPLEFQTRHATDNSKLGNTKWKVAAAEGPGIDLISFLNRAQDTASEEGKRVLVTGRTMIDWQATVVGSCWDYISAVFKRAGYSGKGIVTPFASKQAGPYADLGTIEGGDWLYFINHSYGDVEHSAIFIGWTDQSQSLALMLSYAGGNQAVPARYKEYELTSVYNIMRPKAGTAAALPLIPAPAPMPFTNPALFESPNNAQPISLAVSAGGTLFVVDSAQDQIEKYDLAGKYLGGFAVAGPRVEVPASLSDLVIDSQGNLLVLEQGAHRIEKFSPEGKSLAAYSWLGPDETRESISPDHFSTDLQGNFYVNDAGTKTVIKLDPRGQRMDFALSVLSDSAVLGPGFIRVDPKGNILIYEMQANRIDRFNPDGTLSLSLSAPSTGPGQFANLSGMNIDAAGNLYLLDGHQGLIFQFDGAFKFVQQLKNHFSLPTSIDFDVSGNAYVSDMDRGRVIKFKN